jgi:hypothetical protein
VCGVLGSTGSLYEWLLHSTLISVIQWLTKWRSVTVLFRDRSAVGGGNGLEAGRWELVDRLRVWTWVVWVRLVFHF